MDPASAALRRLRVLIALWSTTCTLLAVGAVVLGVSYGQSLATRIPLEDAILQAERYTDAEGRVEELDVDQAVERVNAAQGFLSSGSGSLVGLGVLTTALLWLLGMVPLGALYLVERARYHPVEHIELLPKRRGRPVVVQGEGDAEPSEDGEAPTSAA